MLMRMQVTMGKIEACIATLDRDIARQSAEPDAREKRPRDAGKQECYSQ